MFYSSKPGSHLLQGDLYKAPEAYKTVITFHPV